MKVFTLEFIEKLARAIRQGLAYDGDGPDAEAGVRAIAVLSTADGLESAVIVCRMIARTKGPLWAEARRLADILLEQAEPLFT